VVKVIWQKGRITAIHGRLSCIRQVVPMCTRPNTLLASTWVHNPNAILISLAIFAQLTTVSLGMPRYVLSPKNCAFAWGSLDPNLTLDSLDPPESTSQIAFWSVQLFLQGSLLWQTDWQTDHTTRSVTLGRIYSTTLRPNNKNYCYQDDVFDAVIMTISILRVHPVHLTWTLSLPGSCWHPHPPLPFVIS